jgi:hypothetical protein
MNPSGMIVALSVATPVVVLVMTTIKMAVVTAVAPTRMAESGGF